MRMRMLSDGPAANDASTAPPLLVAPPSALTGRTTMLPPEAGDGCGSVYPDSNVVVVLAAVLCVLICALGLNSLVRCTRHCGRSLAAPRDVDTAAAAMAVGAVTLTVIAAPAAVAGLSEKELSMIPVVEYETKGAGVAGAECAICLGEFVDGEKVRLLPMCHHGFHVRCIDMWLAGHSSCPICRNSLLDDDHRHGAGDETVTGDELAT